MDTGRHRSNTREALSGKSVIRNACAASANLKTLVIQHTPSFSVEQSALFALIQNGASARLPAIASPAPFASYGIELAVDFAMVE